MSLNGVSYDLEHLFPEQLDFAEEEMCMKDYAYMKQLYPKEIRLISSVLEEYLDRYEYEGNPMYAQYPDAVTIYRIATDIFRQLALQGSEEELFHLKNLIQVMVCQEMYVRRRRHDRFCRKFYRDSLGQRI